MVNLDRAASATVACHRQPPMDWEHKPHRLDFLELGSLSKGAVLCDKYRIVRKLASGGMAEVYEAEQMRLGRRVAVKILRQELCDDMESNRRFEREARAAAQLRGNHVAQILDVDNLQDGSLFLVFEFLNGEDLGQVLEHRRRFTVSEAAFWVLQACEAMAEAHALGIVHRDLKPENLFLHQTGEERVLKVLDFGVSKVDDNTVLTRTRTSIGTPLYMSPEQIMTPKLVDHRSDIWSLGVVLYEMVTGRLPFHGKNKGDLAVAITRRPIPRPRKYVPELPESLVRILERSLDKDPARRYQSVDALASDLRPFVEGTPHSLRVDVRPLSAPALLSELAGAPAVPVRHQFATTEQTQTRRFEPASTLAPVRHPLAVAEQTQTRRFEPVPIRRLDTVAPEHGGPARRVLGRGGVAVVLLLCGVAMLVAVWALFGA